MPWNQFWAYLFQALILLFVLFVASAIVAAVIDGMKKSGRDGDDS